MQTPICEVCLKSDILCNLCKEKLENGVIDEKEIDVARFLYTLEEKIRNLREAKLIKVLDSNNMFVITGKGDAAKFVGRQGSIVKALAKRYNKAIRVIEHSDDLKEFVENLISPASLAGINVVYTPEGEVFRVRIPSNHQNRLLISQQDFSNIIKSLFTKNVEMIFEAQ